MFLNQFHALLIHELKGRQDLSQHGSAGRKRFLNPREILTSFRQIQRSETKINPSKACIVLEVMFPVSRKQESSVGWFGLGKGVEENSRRREQLVFTVARTSRTLQDSS